MSSDPHLAKAIAVGRALLRASEYLYREPMQTSANTELLGTAVHELSHCAVCLTYGLKIRACDVIPDAEGRYGKTQCENPINIAFKIIDSSSMSEDQGLEIVTAGLGVQAILAFAGQCAERKLNGDGGLNTGAWDDNRQAFKAASALGCSLEEVQFLHDQAQEIVNLYWQRIVDSAPILVERRTLDGATVERLLKG